MSGDVIIDIFRQMLYIVVMTVSIIVVPGLLVGLLIAMFQAATQINEMTLSFLPKLFTILAVVAVLLPWLLNMLVGYTQTLVMDIPSLIR
jgi:flagellar biosynthetic protein FliQ